MLDDRARSRFLCIEELVIVDILLGLNDRGQFAPKASAKYGVELHAVTRSDADQYDFGTCV